MQLRTPFRAADLTGFDRALGYERIDCGDGEVRARIPVTAALLQPFGLVHGGVYAAVAETLASLGTHLAVQDAGEIAVGLANATNFIRPLTGGTLHAHAQAVHRGRTTWLWDVRATDDAGNLCALTRMTIAVRPAAPADAAPPEAARRRPLAGRGKGATAERRRKPRRKQGFRNQADDGPRTRDLRLGKPTLYQLSYIRVWRDLTHVRRVGWRGVVGFATCAVRSCPQPPSCSFWAS